MSISGKNCLITGANTGLGFAVSKRIAALGANTVLVCRNKEKGETAVSEIKKELPDASVEMMLCDLSSIKSIQTFVDEFKGKYSRLDILVNNAAVMKKKRTVTQDGYEMMFQVNYLAPFILMNSFLDLLRNGYSPSIINIARPAEKYRLDIDDLQFNHNYHMFHSFLKTKLYLLLGGLELSRRPESDGITVTMIDPGPKPFKSDLVRDVPLMGWIKNLFSSSVDEAAENMVYHITSDKGNNNNGKVYKEKEEKPLTDYWKDTRVSKQLWSITESLIENL